MANSMLFYLLTSQTTYLQENQFGEYMKEFKWFYIVSLVAIMVDFVAGLAAVASVQQGNDELELIGKPWFLPLNIASQIAFATQSMTAARHSAFVLHKRHWQIS